MTRKSSILSLVPVMLAALVAAAPAGATDGYRSADSILASSGTQTTNPISDPGAKPLFSGSTSTRSPSGGSGSEYRSADAIVAATGRPQPSQVRSGGQPYVDALVRNPGASQPQPVPVVETRAGDGFQWIDALIGASVTSGLLLMLVAARSVARHRRATVESRA